MRRRECTEEHFRHAVREHELFILIDNGVYRHLRMKKPGTFAYSYDIVTWPGHLAISGDMDACIFTRLTDMFEFFRQEAPRGIVDLASTIHINPQYWSEKVVAAPHRVGIEQFSSARFEQVVKERIEGYISEYATPEKVALDDEDPFDQEELDADAALRQLASDLREAVNEYPLSRVDSEESAYRALKEFNDDWEARLDGHEIFSDLSDYDFKDYSFHFIWILYAIAWAIRVYDSQTIAYRAMRSESATRQSGIVYFPDFPGVLVDFTGGSDEFPPIGREALSSFLRSWVNEIGDPEPVPLPSLGPAFCWVNLPPALTSAIRAHNRNLNEQLPP